MHYSYPHCYSTVRSCLMKMTVSHHAFTAWPIPAPHPPSGLYTFMLHSILCTLCSFNFVGELFSRACFPVCQKYCLSVIMIHFKVFVSSLKEEEQLVVLIPSGRGVKRTHLTLAEAATCSFQNKSPFGTVCLCVVGRGLYFFYTYICVLSVKLVFHISYSPCVA